MSKQTRDSFENGAKPKIKRHTRQTIVHPCSDVEGDSPAPNQLSFGTNNPDSHADVSMAGSRNQKKVWASEALTLRRKSRPNDDESSLCMINPTTAPPPTHPTPCVSHDKAALAGCRT